MLTIDPATNQRFLHRFPEGWPPWHWLLVGISRVMDRLDGHTWLHEFWPLTRTEGDDYCIHCLKSCPRHPSLGVLS